MAISPDKIQIQRAVGSGSMDEAFWIEGQRHALVFARAHFVDLDSADPTAADLTISVTGIVNQADIDGPHDATLAKVLGRGAAADLNLRVLEDEMHAWIVDPGYGFRVEWTNPDSDDLGWGLEVGLYPIGE